MPLYQLLGGRSRRGALAYGHAAGRDVPELLDSVRAVLAEGYRAVRIQTGVPGLDAVYGVDGGDAATGVGLRGGGNGAAGDHPLPFEEVWDTAAYLRHIPTVFEAVRHEFGPGLPCSTTATTA